MTKIFIAGGTGVIGRRLVPLLVSEGHEVTATTRRADRAGTIHALGARAAVVNVFDRAGVDAALETAGPEVVVHLLTDLAGGDFAANSRVREEGTPILVDAALAVGVDRMLVESIAWVFPDGDSPATDDEAIVPGTAVARMEHEVTRMPHSSVLRFGLLYGPDTFYAADGMVAVSARAGTLAATDAIAGFLHADDAALATVAALGWPDGNYNIVDDEPAPGTEWAPVFAAGLGAPPPAYEPGTPHGRSASNAGARSRGWVPRHPSWRAGFFV